METPSRSTDDQTRDQAQYRNGPEAGHWLVHEHRYERTLAPFTRLVLGAAAVARTDRVLDVGCGTGSTTRTATRDADDGQTLGVDISRRPLLLRAEQRARQDGLTSVGFEHGDAQTHRLAVVRPFGHPPRRRGTPGGMGYRAPPVQHLDLMNHGQVPKPCRSRR